jgi:outer membrane protein TolC
VLTHKYYVCLPLLFLISSVIFAADKIDPPLLPDPLTLEHALSLIDRSHPDIALAMAQRSLAEADLVVEDSSTDLYAGIEAAARIIEPSRLAFDQSNQDHEISFIVRKRLYDYGRNDSLLQAAEYEVKGQQWRVIEAQNQWRILIMKRFFDVLLADLAYARDNEDMSVAYVQYDRLKDRNELGQRSDLVVLDAQSKYMETRRRRYHSAAMQRITRSKLAISLDFPDQLPSNLVAPDLKNQTRPLPEIDALITKARNNNLKLRAMQDQLDAAGKRIEAVRAQSGVKIDAEFEVSAYKRDVASNDEWQASINFDIPVYTGNRDKSKVGQRTAEYQRLKSLMAREEMRVREAAIELRLQLEILQAEKEELQVLYEFKELSLDRNRALYEMEVKADLGLAMVETTSTRYRITKTNYQIELAWARLDAFTGSYISESEDEKKPTE